MRTVYLECNSGISGDMTVAALLDLGADWEKLNDILKAIPDKSFEVKRSRVMKAGIECMDFDVVLDSLNDGHDHDMEYLHGKVHQNLDSHEHHHSHRKLKEINEIIDGCPMSEDARRLARRIFYILAEAEAKAHSQPVEEVHFHEVGALDSIVDIISVAFCIDDLKIGNVIITKLCEGSGTIRCRHGILPIPVPATANIIQKYNIPLSISEVQGEFVTPTGAAIVAALRTHSSLPDHFTIEKIGLGSGKRSYAMPSILRAMLINQDECTPIYNNFDEDTVYRLECEIDDSSGEMLGFAMERLFENGALDVHYFPVYMKKNRPAYRLNVICNGDKLNVLEKTIFETTTTIGIRVARTPRVVLRRRNKELDTPIGTAMLKECIIGDRKKYYPEYESVVSLCRKNNMSYDEVYNIVLNCALQN